MKVTPGTYAFTASPVVSACIIPGHPHVAEGVTAMQRRKRVLVLDFDADLLIMLERLLEDCGFSTVTTWNVEDALEMVESHCVDFFVVGDRPPALDAAYLLERIRRNGVKCGSFVLGRDGNSDGISNVIDCIRAFPVEEESFGEPPADVAVELDPVGSRR
jgi:CheY-like chemotaxis protein